MQYSVWIIPYSWKTIKKNYNMDFIPHIPITKNHTEIPKIELGTYNIVFQKRSGHFVNYEPLKMFSLDCYISGIGKSNFPIYFTSIGDLSGSSIYDKMCECPENTTGYMCVANTFEINSSCWSVI